jgi:hypothetical protein
MRIGPLFLLATIALASGFFAPRGTAQPRGAHRARLAEVGCADGEREAFRSLRRHPDIAGCAGGWDIPGVAIEAEPHCERHGGDDGTNPPGESCNVTDLCAAGWHVCRGASDVAAHSSDGCAGAHDAHDAFFITRASGPGCGVCATGAASDCTGFDCRADCAPNEATHNDVFGCGTAGAVPDALSCGVLDRFSHDQCAMLPAPWACADDGTGTHEAQTVTHPGAAAGGALCCRD